MSFIITNNQKIMLNVFILHYVTDCIILSLYMCISTQQCLIFRNFMNVYATKYRGKLFFAFLSQFYM